MAFNILTNLPEVKGPLEKKLSFNTKLKWTIIILVLFFILSNIPLQGLTVNALERFQYLSLILGASFGSLMSLGIGPIVTASIVLQLLVGSKLLNLDLKKPEDKRKFQGLQKILALAFCLFEATVFVLMGGLQARAGFEILLILQLFLGGLLVIFMDEVVSKWGFGSGVSLFIVAGVAAELFTRAFGFFITIPGAEGLKLAFCWQNPTACPGRVWFFLTSIVSQEARAAAIAFASIAATIIVFVVVVYTQSLKVEIPLSFGRIRGFGIRWPLSFFYTSNIPVILTSALLANFQIAASLLERAGKLDAMAVAPWITGPDNGSGGGLVSLILSGSVSGINYVQALVYLLIMVAGSIMFAVFWMKTSGMDASSQAENLAASGLQIPGFRRDPRVIETILNRYIVPLTIMGGAAVGLLAALADLGGALVRGTGILLAVMIIYRMYEDIAQQHAMDMNPMARKFIAT